MQDGEVYSKYHHPSRKHVASVINGYGERATSPCVAKGAWANAAARAKPGVVDHAYWRYC